MKLLDEFYLRNKKIFNKLGIFTDNIPQDPSKALDLTSSSEIDGFIKKLAKPGFVGSDLSGSRMINPNAYTQLLRRQTFNQEFMRRVSWVFSNPVVKALIIAWGLFNIIMLLLLIF